MKATRAKILYPLRRNIDRALSGYAKSDWLTQQRAEGLFYVNMIIMVGAFLDGVLSSFFLNRVTPTIASDAVLFIGFLLSTIYLVKGRFVTAVNITIFVAITGITFARVVSTGKFSPDFSYDVIQYVLELVVIVFLLVLLAKRTWQIVVATIVSVALLGFYSYSLTELFHLPPSGAALSVIVSGFVFLALGGTLATVTFILNAKAIAIAERESAANKENAGKLRAMLDLSMHLVGLLTPSGTILEVNQSALDFSGIKAVDVIGKPFWETAWWSHSTEMQSKVRTAIQSAAAGQLVQFEATHRSASGNLRVVDFSLKPVFVEDGKVGFLLPEGRDITEHKELEQALTESWSRYQTLFDVAEDAIFLIRDDVFVECNAKTLAMFGVRSDQIIGQTPWRFSPEVQPDGCESRQKAMERIRGALDGTAQSFEWQHCRHDGSLFDAEVTLARMELAKGDVFVLAIVRDISVRKRAVEALRESEERYRLLVENLPIMMTVSQDDKVVYINSEGLRILKARLVDEILGKSVYDFIAPEYWEAGKTRRYRLQAPGSTAELAEFRLRRLDGTLVDVETVGVGITYNGRPGILNLISDISARKLSEEALQNSMEQLHMLAARLESIREEERKLISHEVHDELGQVLTALRLDLAYVKQSGGTDLRLFEEKMQSMLSLTNGAIKTVQNISSKLRPGLLDDLGLIAAVEWQTEDFQKRSGVKCTLDLPKSELDLDDGRSTVLFRILQEALTNVARHAQAQQVKVSMMTTHQEVILSVVDDGVGITEDQRLSTKSLGLLGIRERLHPFRGICIIRRREEGGTELRVSIPKESPS